MAGVALDFHREADTKMEKFDEMNYKGFRTEFYIVKSIKDYFKKKGINLERLKQRSNLDNDDYSLFYETLLFEMIDKNGDGNPDKKFGKKFKIVYYQIARRNNKQEDDLEYKIIEKIKSKIEYNHKDELGEGTKGIELGKDNVLEVKYKILIVK